MKILVITSCTGEKAISSPDDLTRTDFEQGATHIAQRERALAASLLPAQQMYTGQQHIRLMHGVEASRDNTELTVEVNILSAGYGLVHGDLSILPYEVTFTGMPKRELKSWATKLDVPRQIQQKLAEPYDLGIILLGDNYLSACQLNEQVVLGGPTVLFCGSVAAKRLPTLKQLQVITLNNKEAKEFKCGIIGLKGELAGRLLRQLAEKGQPFIQEFFTATKPLSFLGTPQPHLPKQTLPKTARLLAPVEYGPIKRITLSNEWADSAHKAHIKYFIPDWDDLVDPNYDFLTETHSSGKASWQHDQYAHELYPQPNYDGLLVSRAVVEKSARRLAMLNALGVHQSLRVPDNFPIMGDCGAFNYITQDKPPYSTTDVIEYYTKYKFDLGVSVDHIIIPHTYASAHERYQLTIQNAEDFLKEHRRLGLPWRPIGAVQGWDAASYAQAAEQYVRMGYDYIALGGLVRTSTPEMLRIVSEVTKAIPRSVDLHLFGIARLSALRTFAGLGVTSVDSASHLRKAWLGSNDNYWTHNGEKYAAIRVPQLGTGKKAKELAQRGNMIEARLLEQRCLGALRQYDQGLIDLYEVLDVVVAYDQLLTPGSKRRQDYERTLRDKPWKSCPCQLCRTEGIEIIIFRGNNRNRRRGFHNTYVFYELMKRVLTDDQFYIDKAHSLFETTAAESLNQLAMF
jgi:hypothetical protein